MPQLKQISPLLGPVEIRIEQNRIRSIDLEGAEREAWLPPFSDNDEEDNRKQQRHGSGTVSAHNGQSGPLSQVQ